MNTLLKPEDLNNDWSPPNSWFYSRVYWREVSKCLPDYPHLLDESKKWVENELIEQNHPLSKKYTLEWQKILNKGMDEVIKVLSSFDDDYSQVMRSTTPHPLGKVISQEERLELIEKVKKELKYYKNEEASV